MFESRRLHLQLLAISVVGMMACESRADSSSTDSYAHLVAFDTAEVRVVSHGDTARLAGAPYIAALEVNAGYFARKRIRVGDRVLLSDTVSRRPASRPRS